MSRAPLSTVGPLSTLVHSREETLDPEDWEDFRRASHEMLDTMIDFQRDAHTTPAWRPLPESIEKEFLAPAPASGLGRAGAFDAFGRTVLPYPTGLHHPRWWGWAGGTGSPMGMIAAMVGSGMNAVPGNFNDSSTRVEAQLVEWMKELFGFPQEAGGLVTSGASIATLIALTVARDRATQHQSTRLGVRAIDRPLTVYASTEVHSSVHKAAQVLGIGREAVRAVPVDEDFRISIPALRARIQKDMSDNVLPFAIVGTAGTINTGAIDDLDALADIAQEFALWYHVDGAFGAMAALSPSLRDRVRGLSRADSLTFDFHKWMFVNYEAGCVLIRDRAAQEASFSAGGDYLKPLERGTGSLKGMVGARGLQLSRGFKALKPWMSLLEHGYEKFGRLVDQNVRQARYVADLIDSSKHLRRVAPVSLNVVAFRFEADGLAGDQADHINRELLMRLQERGIAIPSSTVVGGLFTLRICICNHRTKTSDLDAFVASSHEIIDELLREEL